MTYRAVDILKEVDVIACEDTRRTGKLLKEFGIDGRMISYYDHVESDKALLLAEVLKAGSSAAIVSDAGTPGIADPGFRAVTEAIGIGARIVAVPGAAAFVAALTVSGLPTDSVFFGGFLPSKKGERVRRLRQIRDIPATLVFYEAPHRIAQSLADCLEVLGDRESAMTRELTKVHEECVRNSISGLLKHVDANPPRGEIVLLFDRAGDEASDAHIDDLVERYNELLHEGSDPKKALKLLARETGLSRSEVYRRLHIVDGE